MPDPAPLSLVDLLSSRPDDGTARPLTVASRRLSMADLATLAWCCEHLPPDGPPIIAGTLYRLGQAVYGREPDGKERRLMLASLDRLVECSVRLPGFDALSGRYVGNLVGRSTANLVEAIYVEHERLHVVTPADRGRLRGTANLRVALTGWFAAQVRAGFVTYLDLTILRALGNGLAARTWALLEAERWKSTSAECESVYISLAAPALASLGLQRYRRLRDARRKLGAACERIRAVDHRYLLRELTRLGIELRPGGPALVAQRLKGAVARRERERIRAEIRASLDLQAGA